MAENIGIRLSPGPILWCGTSSQPLYCSETGDLTALLFSVEESGGVSWSVVPGLPVKINLTAQMITQFNDVTTGSNQSDSQIYLLWWFFHINSYALLSLNQRPFC
jgi:hypothetical protein